MNNKREAEENQPKIDFLKAEEKRNGDWKSLEIDNKEFKFKKFLDQENIFYETTSDIEIRLREIPKYTIPKIPLSSKWVDWPKTKTIFKTNNTTTQVFGDMKLAVYKFERIVEE